MDIRGIDIARTVDRHIVGVLHAVGTTGLSLCQHHAGAVGRIKARRRVGCVGDRGQAAGLVASCIGGAARCVDRDAGRTQIQRTPTIGQVVAARGTHHRAVADKNRRGQVGGSGTHGPVTSHRIAQVVQLDGLVVQTGHCITGAGDCGGGNVIHVNQVDHQCGHACSGKLAHQRGREQKVRAGALRIDNGAGPGDSDQRGAVTVGSDGWG